MIGKRLKACGLSNAQRPILGWVDIAAVAGAIKVRRDRVARLFWPQAAIVRGAHNSTALVRHLPNLMYSA
jgi:hypothetical protein